jgi:ATP-dependent DNA ligase
MFKAFEFCLPTTGTKVPAGPEWLDEIKYDGFRIRVERDDDRVRLIARGGYDWTKRYPLKNRQKRFVIDGEAVVLGVDGISDFDALLSGKHNEEGSKAHPPNAKDIGFDSAAVNTVLRTGLKLAGISIYSITESNGDERRGAMVLAKARDPSPA